MRGLPKLIEPGRVAFPTREALAHAWERDLRRGALTVDPEMPLAPLEMHTLSLEGGHLESAVEVRVEVLVVQPGRALLRLVSPGKGVLARLAPPIEPAPDRESEPDGDEEHTDPRRFVAYGVPSAEGDAVVAEIEPVTGAPPEIEPVVETDPGLEAELMPAPEAPMVAEAQPEPEPTTDAESVVEAQADAEPEATTAPVVEARTAEPEPERDESATRDDVPPPASSPVALPPLLDDRSLRFRSRDDLESARHDLESVAATLAISDAPLTAPTERDLVLVVGDRESRTHLRASLSPGPNGTVVVQLQEVDTLAEALVEVAPPAPPASEPRAESRPADSGVPVAEGSDEKTTGGDASSLTLALSGPIRNPRTPEEVLALPFLRAPTTEEQGAPSTPLLLRWLLGTRGCLRVHLEAEGRPAYSFLVVDGKELRAPVSASTLARSLACAEGSYRIERIERAPVTTHKGRMASLLTETLRALLVDHAQEDLEAGLAKYRGHAPKLNATGQRLVDVLGLEGGHLRLAKKRLDGSLSFSGLLGTATGARTALELLYLLELGGGLDWIEGAGADDVKGTAPRTSDPSTLLPEAERVWTQLEQANLFEVLGLHWSAAPSQITPAFKQLEAEWGPAGDRRKRASAELGRKIWERIQEAHRTLGNEQQRRAYRKSAFSLKWSQQVELLIDRAKLALYRKEVDEAVQILEACQDIWPTHEAQKLLAKIKTKLLLGKDAS